MALAPHPGLFASIERQCVGRNPSPELRLIDGSQAEGVPVALEQARRLLYDPSGDRAVRDALWYQIAERGRTAAPSDWPLAAVWLGLPGLRRTVFRITHYCRAERGDVEAELVTNYLETLAELGPTIADPGATVLRSACSHAWTVWRKAHNEVSAEDMERFTCLPAVTGGLWQADYDPPERPDGLSATLRITVPAHRREGVRTGALAQAWGLADTATDTGHLRRGRQVGTMSLRRVRGNG
ncbi:hypothetical protein ABZ924_11355 [Streptomyces sp. NPDC046876]|uniref:hypothetical protein n=1 Tax=Streptomyces sp. NPDC046876 TaxID=3155616 RepID=UPI0033FEE3E6